MKIRKSETVYLISPHLDDAVFSAGGFISKIAKTNKVVLVNIFTSTGEARETLSSKTYLKQVNYQDSTKLFKDRIIEDKKAADTIGIHRIINLGFVDALWREKRKSILGKILPELDRVYPTYRYHIIKGKVSRHDKKLIVEIASKLKKIISPKSSAIFCPLGFGNHVDHLVVRESCQSAFGSSNLTYWADYPYINRENSQTDFYSHDIFESTSLPISPLQKTKVCALYKTQYSPVLNNKSMSSTETYYKYLSPKFKSNVSNLLYALIHEPKDTIFNILNYKKTAINIRPFSVKDLKVANQIVQKIKEVAPYACPKLIGSLALKSVGQGDIDIVVGVSIDKFQDAVTALSVAFGQAVKTDFGFTQWKMQYKGKNVDMDLLDMQGKRYVLQTDQVNKILSSSIYLNEYHKLKYSTSATNKFWYSIARVIFFHKLNNHKLPNNILESISHSKPFGTKKHAGAYTFSVYKDSKNKKIFVKKWSGKKRNLTYYWLKNEIAMYKLLSNLKISGPVFTPKFIFSQQTDNSLYLGLEYLKGRDLSKLDTSKKLNIFFQSTAFLDKVYKLSSKKDLVKVSHRGPFYWLSILPFITFRATILHPRHMRQILQKFLHVYLNFAKLVFRRQRTLVHRDFNNYNCFLSKDKICLIDFQLTCIADPMVEYAVILLKYFDSEDLKTQVITKVACMENSKGNMDALESYLTVFAIYDLSLSDGSHFLSLPAITKGVKIKQ